MTGYRYWFGSLIACGLMAASAGAQGTSLGHTIVDGNVAPASFASGGWGAGAGCGAAAHEPTCGSMGLGYAGGFGNCGSCGTGGYLNRNLHQVQPCACGGSPIADFARGVMMFVDKTVSSVLGGIFGGLQTVTCHASGSFAALQCAAMAGGGCSSCGGGSCDGGCDMGPGCGVPMTSSGMGYATGASAVVSEGYAPSATYQSAPQMMPTLAPSINSTPMQSLDAMPIQPPPVASPSDPFIDDPVPSPQARRAPTGQFGARSQVRPASYQQQPSRMGSAFQRAVQATKANTMRLQNQNRYLQGRVPNLRR